VLGGAKKRARLFLGTFEKNVSICDVVQSEDQHAPTALKLNPRDLYGLPLSVNCDPLTPINPELVVDPEPAPFAGWLTVEDGFCCPVEPEGAAEGDPDAEGDPEGAAEGDPEGEVLVPQGTVMFGS
jgi:hypothetical protein